MDSFQPLSADSLLCKDNCVALPPILRSLFNLPEHVDLSAKLSSLISKNIISHDVIKFRNKLKDGHNIRCVERELVIPLIHQIYNIGNTALNFSALQKLIIHVSRIIYPNAQQHAQPAQPAPVAPPAVEPVAPPTQHQNVTGMLNFIEQQEGEAEREAKRLKTIKKLANEAKDDVEILTALHNLAKKK